MLQVGATEQEEQEEEDDILPRRMFPILSLTYL
jgi:hypothetical protein